MEIWVGERKIGSHTLAFKPDSRGTTPGIAIESRTILDLGDEGRVETTVKGFMSPDLQIQSMEMDEIKTGKDRRTQNFWAQVELAGGEAKIERRINGEKSSHQVKLGDLVILAELAEALQARILEGAKGLLTLPSLGAFDAEPGFLRIEFAGVHKLLEGDVTMDVHVVFLQREEGGLMTYWFDPNQALLRISITGQSLIFKRKKG
jgi:hypothetical protein